jgi:hypothetical protein
VTAPTVRDEATKPRKPASAEVTTAEAAAATKRTVFMT